MTNLNRKQPPTKKQLRAFSLITFTGFSLLAFHFVRNAEFSLAVLFGFLAVLIVGAQFNRRLLFVLYRLWMGLSDILGWISSRILLTLIFYLIFTPIGLLLRLLGKPLLDTSFPDNKHSFWHKRQNGKSDLQKMF